MQVTPALLVPPSYCGVAVEQFDRVQKQVVKVERVIPAQNPLITKPRRRYLALVRGGGACGKLIRMHPFSFLPRGDSKRKSRLHIFGPRLFKRLFHRAKRVGTVIYRRSALVPQRFAVFFNKGKSEGVEGGYEWLRKSDFRGSQTSKHPASHFARRFVGKSDSKYALGLCPSSDNLLDALGDYPGFPRSGSGEHEEGAGYCQNSFLLLSVEFLQMLHLPILAQLSLFFNAFSLYLQEFSTAPKCGG